MTIQNEAVTFGHDPLGQQARSPIRNILLLVVVGSLLALSIVVGKLGIQAGAAPLGFLCITLLVSGSILYFICHARAQTARIRGQVLEYGLVAGLVFLLPNLIGFLAVNQVGAGFLSFTYMFPLLITYCLALVIGMERLMLYRVVAVALGLAGGLLLAMSKVSLGDAPLLWIILTMSAPIVISIGNLYRTMRWPEGVAPLFLASLILLFAGVMLAPIALVFEGVEGIASSFSNNAIYILLAQITVYSALYLLYFVLQKIAGPVYLSQIGSVAAVVGGVIAASLLQETLPANLHISALLVAAGIVLFQMKSLPFAPKQRTD